MNKEECKMTLRPQKEKLIKNLIKRISLEFIGKGIEKKHIDKALKYYLSMNEITDDSIDLSMFASILNKIENELYELALNVEKNFIIELESYNKITKKSPTSVVLSSDKQKKENKILSSNNKPSQEDKVELSTKPKVLDRQNKNDEIKPEPLPEILNLGIEKKIENYNHEHLIRRKMITDTIEKVAKKYEGEGIEDKHVDKAKKHYLDLLDKNHNNSTEKEFQTFFAAFENELYFLAENTKNNYIKQLQNSIINNPKIDLNEKKKIMKQIYPSKIEKEKIVTNLIDVIAKEYSNDGVFDRHIQKAYNIFLKRPEISNDNLTLEEFHSFMEKIEKELYALAEQTKKNYEFYRKESEQYGKVLKKGEDIK